MRPAARPRIRNTRNIARKRNASSFAMAIDAARVALCWVGLRNRISAGTAPIRGDNRESRLRVDGRDKLYGDPHKPEGEAPFPDGGYP